MSDTFNISNDTPEGTNESSSLSTTNFSSEKIKKVTGMYQDWFLDYASYVILERAVPDISDGLKPVQRRILHSMKELDDGRYNKVANIVGHTMQYHPHGDASISDAMVQVGQKDLLIDMQGNWGNIFTGDRAAASRYIEARLSKFALDVVFNPKITDWQLSYDGRKKEPISLPIMFPLLLAQGAEGIAVGLSTKVLPHNFNELIKASIAHLKGKAFEIYPDFITGGIADITQYKDGLRGGKVRVRARIKVLDKNTLIISEIPFSTTTTSLIESILKANEKGKIKIKKVEDNTAATVEILVHLPSNVSADKTLDALYAFTHCEVSISPLGCVIASQKPSFIGVSEMLRRSTDHTIGLLKRELEMELSELESQWHFSSLERIFIENRIYRTIEEQETWEGVISAIDEGLKPFISHLKRAVTQPDIVKLTEIRIKRISKFDIDKAQQRIEALEGEIAQKNHHLANLTTYAISYFQRLQKTYGKAYPRKTELKHFEDIELTKVVMRSAKLYINKAEGFIGTSLRKAEFVCDCSDIDDIICFTQKGEMFITKVGAKVFVAKGLIYAGVFKKKDKRTIYNMVYRDGKGGFTYMKRFAVTGITRDKLYDLNQAKQGTKVLYLSANPNGEAEVVSVHLRQTGSIKKLKFDIDFSELLIKGRSVRGNLVTKYLVNKIELKKQGVSTLQPRKIWFDTTVNRLNVDQRGKLLGAFKGGDQLLLITAKGKIKTFSVDLSLHFDNEILILQKWVTKRPITVVYFESEKQRYYVKRFLFEDANKEEVFLSNSVHSKIVLVATDSFPRIKVYFAPVKGKETRESECVNLHEFISIKGIKAMGNQLTSHKVGEIEVLDPLPELEEEQSTVGNDQEKNGGAISTQSTLFDTE